MNENIVKSRIVNNRMNGYLMLFSPSGFLEMLEFAGEQNFGDSH